MPSHIQNMRAAGNYSNLSRGDSGFVSIDRKTKENNLADQSGSVPLASSCPESAGLPAHAGGRFRHLIVVAEPFAAFARHERVVTMSHLVELIAAKRIESDLVVRLGQGLDHSDRTVLEETCRRAHFNKITIDGGAGLDRILDRTVVHKGRQENVLLANLRNVAPNRWVVDLRVHRNNEFVLDHLTGEHLQGILIIEAMRQLCIALFETQFRKERPNRDYAGVWNSMELTFEGFIFPLCAEVGVDLKTVDLRNSSNLKFKVTTSLMQNRFRAARADICYSMIDKDRLAILELRKADQLLQSI
jgi:hypothetical protein